MLSPEVVLRVVGMPPGPAPAAIRQKVLLALREARATLKSEVEGFVRDHMPELGAQNLWSLCEAELPLNEIAPLP
jgi:hypothetical protein